MSTPEVNNRNQPLLLVADGPLLADCGPWPDGSFRPEAAVRDGLRGRQADADVMYCTNAARSCALPQLAVAHIPGGVEVRRAYNIGAHAGSAAVAWSRSYPARRAAASCLRTGSINAPP